jgi:hypothetical protein
MNDKRSFDSESGGAPLTDAALQVCGNEDAEASDAARQQNGLTGRERELEKSKRLRRATAAGAASTRRFGIGLIAGLQILSGCTSDDEERSKAISEVEAHCDLPTGMLSEIYALRMKQLGKTAPSEVGKEGEQKLIYFGILLTQPIVEKHDCITSFESSNGYRFNFHIKTPF